MQGFPGGSSFIPPDLCMLHWIPSLRSQCSGLAVQHPETLRLFLDYTSFNAPAIYGWIHLYGFIFACFIVNLRKKQGLNELSSFDRSYLLRQVFHDINSIFCWIGCWQTHLRLV